MAERRRISVWSRVLGILAILAALVGAGVPTATAVAIYRGLSVADFLTPATAVLAGAVAGAGLVLAVAGLIVGRRAASAFAVIGLFLSLGALAGLAVAVVVPVMLRS